MSTVATRTTRSNGRSADRAATDTAGENIAGHLEEILGQLDVELFDAVTRTTASDGLAHEAIGRAQDIVSGALRTVVAGLRADARRAREEGVMS